LIPRNANPRSKSHKVLRTAILIKMKFSSRMRKIFDRRATYNNPGVAEE
jgi:hypothetical protein